MLKRFVTCCLILMLAVAATSPAWSRPAAERSASKDGRAVAPTRGALTFHRLLQARLDLIQQLAGVLSELEEPPASGGGNTTHTIIDEPDPAGRDTPKQPGDGGDDSDSGGGNDDQDGTDDDDNVDTSPVQALG